MMVSPRMWGILLAVCAMVPLASSQGWFGGASATPKTETRELEMYEAVAENFTNFFLTAENWRIPGLPVFASFLDLVLTLDTCASYRRHQGSKKHPWLQVLFACMIGTFGGTTATAVFLGETPGWLHAGSSPIAFAIGFWMIFCCPGDLPYKMLTRQRWVELLFGYINSISCGHAITSWGQDNVLNNVHLERCGGSGPLMVLCGTVAGCGGGILAAWMHMGGATEDWAFSTPPVLKSPSITVRTAFMTSLIYYMIRNPHSYFGYGTDAFVSHNHAKAIIWLIWLIILTGAELLRVAEPWQPLTSFLGKVLQCPALLGGAPEDGIYEKLFGQAGKEHVHVDAILAGFGFKKDKQKAQGLTKPEGKKTK
ncbi:hypothetical protein T484DRAFT_1963890 [Baffinella frigidus]|nr:hypothetical protein T484DRAFT_1963890 [Cryptophyta sp. CCMP2293]